MKDWIVAAIIVVVWLVLQFVIFPKLGLPT
jgi:hypothetical protein